MVLFLKKELLIYSLGNVEMIFEYKFDFKKYLFSILVRDSVNFLWHVDVDFLYFIIIINRAVIWVRSLESYTKYKQMT